MQISHFKRSTGLSVIFNDEIDIMEQVAINILIQISIHKTFWAFKPLLFWRLAFM